MKSIAKILHPPSVVQSECYEATRILFLRKENKNNDYIQQFVSSRQRSATRIDFRSNQSVENVSLWRGYVTAYAMCVQWIFFQNGATLTGGDEFLDHTFLDLDSENYLAVNGTVTDLPVFI